MVMEGALAESRSLVHPALMSGSSPVVPRVYRRA